MKGWERKLSLHCRNVDGKTSTCIPRRLGQKLWWEAEQSTRGLEKEPTWEAAVSDQIAQRPGPNGLRYHLSMVFTQAAGFAQLQVSNVWCSATQEEGISHAARGLCIQLLYFHTPISFLHLPVLSLFLVYFRDSLQNFPFSHQGLWEFFILPKESICPISQTHALHMCPLITLTTLFSPHVSLSGLSFSLLPRTLHALHFSFFISLPRSQLLSMLRRLDLFSLFWSLTKSVVFYPEISPEYYSWSDAASTGSLSQTDNAETGIFLLFHFASLMARSKPLMVLQKWK